jgi:hemerythrin-like domain-containing protein
MLHVQESTSKQDVLHLVHEHKRLTTVMRSMAREIERLDEDNTQLRVAVAVYCEILRRYTDNPPD